MEDKAMAMALGTNIPPPLGFRFRPSVTELIHELNRKMLGNAPRIGQSMPTLDLAELDPWEIPGLLNMPWEDEKWHFWYNREKLHSKGNQFKRKGKSGFWKSTCDEEDILGGIGKKRILVYHKGPYPGKRTDWVIHEYALNNESSFVICVLMEKMMKTKKPKRAKKDADIPEILKGEPSGYTTVSDVENPVTPAENVLERGDEEYGSFLPQNLPPLNEGESSYDVTSIGEISHTANSAVIDSVIDSIQPPNSTEGHNEMPISHGFGELEMSVEELMNMVHDPDENICGPETKDGSQKTSLAIPISSKIDELPNVEELLRNFSTDDDISGKMKDDNKKESSQQTPLEMLTPFESDEEQARFKELLKSFTTDGTNCEPIDDIFNGSWQQTSSGMQHFPDNPVSCNMDAEGADGQVDDLGPFAPGGTLQ